MLTLKFENSSRYRLCVTKGQSDTWQNGRQHVWHHGVGVTVLLWLSGLEESPVARSHPEPTHPVPQIRIGVRSGLNMLQPKDARSIQWKQQKGFKSFSTHCHPLSSECFLHVCPSLYRVTQLLWFISNLRFLKCIKQVFSSAETEIVCVCTCRWVTRRPVLRRTDSNSTTSLRPDLIVALCNT